ncbi:hypothetical protein BDN72DRAFT_755805 [Pluteus cervinus]|uniref:Uncharacterized protein n=1 Tax=Pluteus cervinus TaxID=181527 RepID=A0ACD3BEP2_9AGAR|nr:hypothetical protein BDN72DRAFT_755805 [Pluteus cervinus]
MDEDLIVVDDIEPQAGPSRLPPPKSAPDHGTPLPRLRSSSQTPNYRVLDGSERTTRSATQRPKIQPKLKLKLSEKAAAQAPGMSFLGQYDRELDSDEEDVAFEEQFILRFPPGEDLERLRKMVASREPTNDVWFKFKDSRRGVFHIGNSTYSAKLVDLPCIIESQKTLDNKQMFKVADICQMLVVDDKLENNEELPTQRNFNVTEFIYPHGITPPLNWVRKRRFRKRVNRTTIESVEHEVERLLEEDSLATEVKFDVLEGVNPDLSDSEFIENDVPLDAPTPALSDAPTPGADDMDEEDDEEEEEEAEGPEGDIDEELAAELDLALGDDEDGGEGDDEDDEDDESDEDEDDDEDDDVVQARKLLNEEIGDLQAAVAKKQNEIASSANPLIRKRFEDALKKLTADLEMKLAQRDDMKEQQRLRKEGVNPDPDRDTDPEGGVQGGDAEDDGDDGLFGSDDAGPGIAMEIG